MATKKAAETKSAPKGKDKDPKDNKPQSRALTTGKEGRTGTNVAHAAADKYAGEGVSTDVSDNMVPLLYVLQTNSPQVNKRDPKYIEGAEPGDIWLRNAPTPIIKGEEGLEFIPCYFYKDFGEWISRDEGGGLVGRYPELPKDAKSIKDPESPGIPKWESKAGNDLIETRNFAGFALTEEDGPLAYLIPMKGASHSVGKGWMTSMNMKKTPGGRKAPAFAFKYKLTTTQRKNKKGEWFVLQINDAGVVQDEAMLDQGHDLHQAFASGKKVAETEDASVQGAANRETM